MWWFSDTVILAPWKGMPNGAQVMSEARWRSLYKSTFISVGELNPESSSFEEQNPTTSSHDEQNPTSRVRNYTNNGEAGEEDRISSLSDKLIHKIMSFMDTKQAVQSCVLSKRWDSLWKPLPYLDLNFNLETIPLRRYPYDRPPKSPRIASLDNFIAQVIFRRHPTDLVKVCLPSLDSDPCIVGALIAYAVDHNVQQLTIPSGCNRNLVLPPSFYTCQSLTALDVHCYIKLPNFLALPSLKSLNLHRLYMNADFFNPQFFKGCPNLETLKLIDIYGGEGNTLLLNAPRLKRVEISSQTYGKSFRQYAGKGCNIMVEAPVLRSFKYHGYVPAVCSSDDLASIDDVYFDICKWDLSESGEENKEHDEIYLRLINTFKEFRFAKSLTLSSETVEALARFPSLLDKNQLRWSNLKYLEIELQGSQPCNKVEVPGCVLKLFLNCATKFSLRRRRRKTKQRVARA